MINKEGELKKSILSGFSNIEKGGKKTGVYLDTPENRKLGRVGQKYTKEGLILYGEGGEGKEIDLRDESKALYPNPEWSSLGLRKALTIEPF